MPRAVILSAVRTPVGRYGGGLSEVRPDDLAATAIAAAVERAGVPAGEIEDVWFGFANQAGEITRHPIVPTWPRETKVTVTLEEESGGKTKLNVRWSPHNATEVEQKTFDVSHVGMQATWGGTFDRLTAYLARTA